MLTALRKNQRRSTLRLLAGLSLVWLNMALNPCAMALGEPEEHDCPHCPPVQHCAEPAAELCSYIDGIDSDGRTHQARIPDFSDYAFSLPAVATPVPTFSVDSSAIIEFLRSTGPPGPPLYISYCVYLD